MSTFGRWMGSNRRFGFLMKSNGEKGADVLIKARKRIDFFEFYQREEDEEEEEDDVMLHLLERKR
ncbi:hypothetical protein V1477_011237 [Vespula maculifrons]|uniref:Uncharacterized protein n=1 Tax=Vespula maculifrons TaxID=7453 RepID=A0ABD2C650_VESMC